MAYEGILQIALSIELLVLKHGPKLLSELGSVLVSVYGDGMLHGRIEHFFLSAG